MNLLAAAAEAPLSVHEWSQTISVTVVMWAVIAVLGGVVVWYAIGDRSEIKETLKKLVTVIEDLRVDLAENYAKKVEVERLDRKVEKLREHMTARSDFERRAIKDSESGD